MSCPGVPEIFKALLLINSRCLPTLPVMERCTTSVVVVVEPTLPVLLASLKECGRRR